MKPTQPTTFALDADGSEFWLDANGLAFRADCSRVPELDGAPLDRQTLSCAAVVDVLVEAWRAADARYREDVENGRLWDGREGALLERIAASLGLISEFNAALREEVGP